MTTTSLQLIIINFFGFFKGGNKMKTQKKGKIQKNQRRGKKKTRRKEGKKTRIKGGGGNL
jgi:hypothetical protein